MKQTAVEWLEQQLFNKRGKFTKGDIDQAKEMENRQIQEAYEEGYNRVAKLIEDAAKQNGLNLNL
jgi:hypothetical protein